MIAHIEDIPESEIGTLDTGKAKPYKDGVEIHGVKIPHDIVRQLRKDGRSLESFTRGELLDALQGAAIDGKVFDDERGVNFQDRLHLSHAEEKARAHNDEDHRFCDRLEKERAHAQDSHLHDYSHN